MIALPAGVQVYLAAGAMSVLALFEGARSELFEGRSGSHSRRL